MGAHVALPRPSGLAAPCRKAVGWELAPREGLPAWQGACLSIADWGSCSKNFTRPPTPLQPGGSNKASLTRGL